MGKKFLKDQTITYPRTHTYRFHTFDVADLQSLMSLLTEYSKPGITAGVRGAIRDKVDLTQPQRRTHRTSYDGEEIVLEDTPRNWIMLDFDDVQFQSLYKIGSLDYIKEFIVANLPREFQGCEIGYQYSASSGLVFNDDKIKIGFDPQSSTAKLHLWVWTDEPFTSSDIKAIFKDQYQSLNVDLAVFSPSQPHFISDPVFEGNDPISNRWGYIAGRVFQPNWVVPEDLSSENINSDAVLHVDDITVSSITSSGTDIMLQQVMRGVHNYYKLTRGTDRPPYPRIMSWVRGLASISKDPHFIINAWTDKETLNEVKESHISAPNIEYLGAVLNDVKHIEKDHPELVDEFRKYVRRVKKAKRRVIVEPYYQNIRLPLEEAQKKAADLIEKTLAPKWAESQGKLIKIGSQTQPGAAGKAILLNLEAGLGKSSLALRTALAQNIRVLYFVPDHNLAKDLVSTCGDKATQIYGRSQIPCSHPRTTDLLKMVERNEIAENTANRVISKICKHSDSDHVQECAYQQQFVDLERFNVIVLQHAHLTKMPAGLKDLHIDSMIIDEDASSTLINPSIRKRASEIDPSLVLYPDSNDSKEILEAIAPSLDRFRETADALSERWKDYEKAEEEMIRDFMITGKVKRILPPESPRFYKYLVSLIVRNDDPIFRTNTIYLRRGELNIIPALNKLPFSIRSKDLMLLDATADPEVVRKVYQLDELDYAEIRTLYSDDVDIIQDNSYLMGHSFVRDNPGTVMNKLNKHDVGKNDALITYKQFIEANRDWVESTFGSNYINFGRERGFNAFEKVDRLFVVGRMQPAAYALELQARSLWRHFESYDIDTHPHSLQSTEEVLHGRHPVNIGYEMSNPEELQGFESNQYITPLMSRMFDNQIRAGLYQAVHRIRPIRSAGKLQEVHIITSECANVVVDSLATHVRDRSVDLYDKKSLTQPEKEELFLEAYEKKPFTINTKNLKARLGWSDRQLQGQVKKFKALVTK